MRHGFRMSAMGLAAGAAVLLLSGSAALGAPAIGIGGSGPNVTVPGIRGSTGTCSVTSTAGCTFVLTGSGWPLDSELVLTDDVPGLPSQIPVTTDSDGNFTMPITVPAGAPSGVYGFYYGLFASWTVTVTDVPATTTFQVAAK